ncbi:MAG TPA: hypothetical protein PK156_17295 [Polyangium sp.]|nr:hypothetical protein [Polyangium sp.]
MIRVNETQFAALEAYFGEEFVEQMARNLVSSFPVECKPLGREAVLQFVRASVTRARGQTIGAVLDVDLRRYVVTEFVLGLDETAKIAKSERERVLARDGKVDPTVLVFCLYQEMRGRLMTKAPARPQQVENEALG